MAGYVGNVVQGHSRDPQLPYLTPTGREFVQGVVTIWGFIGNFYEAPPLIKRRSAFVTERIGQDHALSTSDKVDNDALGTHPRMKSRVFRTLFSREHEPLA